MSEEEQSTLHEHSNSADNLKAAHIERSSFGDLPDDWNWEQSGEHLKYITSGISES
jgi:hypothetical protein